MLFQELGKLKRTSIMFSIVAMALGIVMAIWPESMVDALIATLGTAMLITATVMVLDFIVSKRALIHFFYLTIALIIGIFGFSVLIFTGSVLRILGWIFGLALLVDGLLGMYNAYTYSRRAKRVGWRVLMGLNALLVLMGLIIFFNPWWNHPHALLAVIGCTMVFSSAVNIMRLIMTWPIHEA